MYKFLLQYNINNIWNANKTNLFYKQFLHSLKSVTQENSLKTSRI